MPTLTSNDPIFALLKAPGSGVTPAALERLVYLVNNDKTLNKIITPALTASGSDQVYFRIGNPAQITGDIGAAFAYFIDANNPTLSILLNSNVYVGENALILNGQITTVLNQGVVAKVIAHEFDHYNRRAEFKANDQLLTKTFAPDLTDQQRFERYAAGNLALETKAYYVSIESLQVAKTGSPIGVLTQGEKASMTLLERRLYETKQKGIALGLRGDDLQEYVILQDKNAVAILENLYVNTYVKTFNQYGQSSEPIDATAARAILQANALGDNSSYISATTIQLSATSSKTTINQKGGGRVEEITDLNGAFSSTTFSSDNSITSQITTTVTGTTRTTVTRDAQGSELENVAIIYYDDGSSSLKASYPDGSTLSRVTGSDGIFTSQTQIVKNRDGSTDLKTSFPTGDSFTVHTDYFYDENGVSRIETESNSSGTIRRAFDTEGNLYRTDTIAAVTPNPALTATTYADVAGLIAAVRAGQPIPILASGIRLANSVTGSNELTGLNNFAAGVLSFYNLYNALQSNDAFGKVNAVLSTVNYANLALQNTGIYSQGITNALNGTSTSIGVLPVAGLVLSIKNNDAIGAALSLGTLVGGAPFLATPLGIGLITASIAKVIFDDGPPDAWGIASVGFAPGITNYGVEVVARGDNFGPDRARAQLQTVLNLFNNLVAQANGASTDSTLRIGLIAQRMPTVTYRAGEFADFGYRVMDINPLTGAQRAPELRFDEQGQLFGITPSQLSAETRAMLTLSGSPNVSPLVAYLINTALSRDALAPLWQVETAKMQQEANDPNAGLSEEERAAKAGLAAAIDTAYAATHGSDAQAANKRLGGFMVVGVDLNGDGLISTQSIAQTRAGNHPITFDWDNQGYLKSVGWVGAQDGFLVIDQNFNGVIDSAKEMLSNPLVADQAKGLRSLAAYDANNDGRIDASDPLYQFLKIWKDTDQDGGNTQNVLVNGIPTTIQDSTAGQAELMSLQQLGITAIDYVNGRFEKAGNSGVSYGSLQTVKLETSEDGVRYTPVGSGIEVKSSNGNPVIVITQVTSGAPVYAGTQIGVSGETIALPEDGRATPYNPLVDGPQIPIIISSSSLLLNDTWAGKAGLESGLSITSVRAGSHSTATLGTDGNITVLLEPNYNGAVELFYTVALRGSESTVAPKESKAILNISPVNDVPTLTNVPAAAKQVYGYQIITYDLQPYLAGGGIYGNQHYTGFVYGEPIYTPYVEHMPEIPSYELANGLDSPGDRIIGYSPASDTPHNTPLASEAANVGTVVASDVDGGSFRYELVGQALYGTATLDQNGNWSYVGKRPGYTSVPDVTGDGRSDYVDLTTGIPYYETNGYIPPNIDSNTHFSGETSFQDYFTVRVFDTSDATNSTYRDVNVEATHFGPPPTPDIAYSGGKKPISIDLNGDGFHFVDIDDSNVFMDVNGDGWKRKISWISAGDGLLAYDKDGDGKVDKFDEFSFVPYATNQQSDLAALKEAFDTNHNGLFDAGDAKWNSFGIWQDSNSNGITDTGEFKTLNSLNIASIGLTSDGKFQVIDGQSVHGIGSLTKLDGSKLATADVTLRYSNEAQVLTPGANGTPVATTVIVPQGLTPLNYVGTADKDLIFGTAASDRFATGDGDDVIVDDGGNDVVDAGAGNDQVYTGKDNDFVQAGAGNDIVYAGAGNDVVFGDDGDDVLMMEDGNDVAFGGAGNDFISGGSGNDVLSGNDGDDVIFGEDGWDVLFGQNGNDELRGMDGDDVLYGGDGKDLLSGGAGKDQMEGGTGDDIYEVDDVGDTVLELLNEGNDTVRSTINYVLGANVENLELVGALSLNGTGNELGNKITGNDANNTLYGLAGNDTLDGGAGADILYGGTGDDTYIIDNVGDSVRENAGEGIDTVLSRVSYTLGANVENLTLVGIESINGTGNDLNNTIIGNAGNNIITGGAGNDILRGNKGNDTLVGGSGDDVYEYALGDGYDTVQDSAGTDTIKFGAGLTFANVVLQYATLNGQPLARVKILDANGVELAGQGIEFSFSKDQRGRLVSPIEKVTFSDGSTYAWSDLLGAGGPIIGTNYDDILLGGRGNDVIYGGSGNDLIYGGAGDDQLMGELGNDTLYGGIGNDTLYGGGGDDELYGDAGDDLLYGDDGNDLLTDLVGQNRFYGGNGNDTILAGSGDDQIDGGNGDDIINAGEGNNTVYGNNDNDVITAGAGDDYLDGGYGNDRIYGGNGVNQIWAGIGNDYVLSGDGNDRIDGGYGVDVIQAGGGNDYVTAGIDNDVVMGGAGVDSLYGEANDDWMSGNQGDDIIDVSTGYNIVAFNKGDGKDTIQNSRSGNDTISLGLGIRYADLKLSKVGNDLVLVVGSTDSLTMKNWYSDAQYHGVGKLQVITVGGDYDAASSDATKNKQVEVFDFGKIVQQFDTARSANAAIASGWAAMDNRLTALLQSSDSNAIGGDLSFQFGTRGNLAGMDLLGAQNAAAGGSTWQALHTRAQLETTAVRLA